MMKSVEVLGPRNDVARSKHAFSVVFGDHDATPRMFSCWSFEPLACQCGFCWQGSNLAYFSEFSNMWVLFLRVFMTGTL